MVTKTAINSSKIFAPGVSVFVSANAGAGKTSLLTNRVLSLLVHGVEPSKILCLTFTNAAAAEMTSRILGELGKWVMLPEAELRQALEHLTGQPPDGRRLAQARSLFALVLESPEGVRIQTIHGFCQSLLRRFPLEARISPHFNVLDSRSTQELLGEARLRLFVKAQTEDRALLDAIHQLAGGAGEHTLQKLLGKIIDEKRQFMSLFHQQKRQTVCARMWEALGVREGTRLAELIEQYFDYDGETLAKLREIATLLAKGEKTDVKMSEGLAAWLEKTPEERIGIFETYTALFIKSNGEARGKLCTNNALGGDEALAGYLREEQQRALLFYKAEKTLALAQRTHHMIVIADALLVIYDQLKRSRAGMDYDDLIIAATRLLVREEMAAWVLFKLDGGIDHLLVDEAQDTSPQQWQIIDALTQDFFAGAGRKDVERSVFVVGDEKQSIFSFQGADVAAFGEMREYFMRRIGDSGHEMHTAALTRSFRSAKEVLSAVDAVFAAPEAQAGLMFSPGELVHIPTRLTHAGLVEAWPLFTPAENEPPPMARLVRQVSDMIARWLESGTLLEARGRPVMPGDIMILVRKRTAFVDRLVRALKRRNIPVAGVDRMMLGDNLAVQDLIALGQVMLLPEDDLTLAALLKSPICNLGEEALFMLAHGRGKQSLWDRLREEDTQHEVYEMLSELRAKVDYLSPFAFYAYALDTLGARNRITGRMGEEYAEAIDEFLSQAMLYERSHTPSMQGFLHWLTNSDSVIKRDMEQARNAVRIMTVHGAKGLQAPIVILPDTADVARDNDIFFWHENLPLWPGKTEGDDVHCARERDRRKAALLAESRRLLYVALTRAEDRLYIFGATHHKNPNTESWHYLVMQGLRPIAEPFDTALGQGLRVGKIPGVSASHTVTVAELIPGDAGRFAFLHRPVPGEPLPPKPLTPSKLPGGAPAAASPLLHIDTYQRGTLIHMLLQYLPEAGTQREEIARRIASGFAGVPPQAQDECIGEALRILDNEKYGFIFAAGSMAEVPIAGNVTLGSKIVSVAGQIDRLCIGERDVWIVDYKSNRNPPATPAEVPVAYRRQMLLYSRLMERIYPDKRIQCALLWTAAPLFMPLDKALLDETALSSYI